MKTFRFFGMVVVAILLSLNFIACSDDDGPGNGSSLAGTTWKIVSVIDQDDWYAGFEGSSVTFKSDGSVVLGPDDDWSYATWSLNEGVLKITFGEEIPDEILVGKIIFDGNTATWHCYGEDVNDSYEDNTKYYAILTLRKQ